MKTLEIAEHGVMLSCFFHGTAGAMLPITVDCNTTVNQIIESLEEEINVVFDHIEYCAEAAGFTGDLDAALKAEIAKMRDHVAETGNGEKAYDSSLDFDFDTINDDGSESPYAIFSVEFKEA